MELKKNVTSHFKVYEVPNTKGRVLTTLDPNDACFNIKSRYLYIGTPLSELNVKNLDSTPKLGHADRPVGETIKEPRNRYGKKDPFVVLEVFYISEDIFNKFGVTSTQQLEELIRKELSFVCDDNYDGKEYWKNKTSSQLIFDTHKLLFSGQIKQTYTPRINQQRAIEKIKASFSDPECEYFLLAMEMRTGKNFVVMSSIVDMEKENNNTRVLVITNKPSGVFSSLEKQINEHIKFKDFTIRKGDEVKTLITSNGKYVDLVSKQLLDNVANLDLINTVVKNNYDYVIIDESHSGIETELSRKIIDSLKGVRKIYMTGTPQKQIGKIEFTNKNTFIYDQKDLKKDFDNGLVTNVVINKTMLIKISDELIKIQNEMLDDKTGRFTFTKFYSLKTGSDKFVYEKEILDFWMLILGKKNTPYLKSKFDFLSNFNHMLVMLPTNVKVVKALKKLLENNFGEYEIISAAGDGFNRHDMEMKLNGDKKTITFTIERLIEGETQPKWEASINMSDTKSYIKYAQFSKRPNTFDDDNPNKESWFIDFNPSTFFEYVLDYGRNKGYVDKELDDYLKEYFISFNILCGETIFNMKSIDFIEFKSEMLNLGNMSRSINNRIYFDSIDFSKFAHDFSFLTGKSSKKKTTHVINDNDTGGGKNYTKIKKESKKSTDKKISQDEKLKNLFIGCLSRLPYILHTEKDNCKSVNELISLYKKIDKRLFESAVGIPLNVFERYWFDDNFIDSYNLDFYLTQYSQTMV